MAGDKRLAFEKGVGVELIRAAKKETKVKIGVNIAFFRFDDKQICAGIIKKLSDTRADFIEMEFSGQSSVRTEVDLI